jgi:hypothetical protein
VDNPHERISQRSENFSESILVSSLQSARKGFISNFNLVYHAYSEYGKFGRTGLFSGVVRSNLPLFHVEITRNETAKIHIFYFSCFHATAYSCTASFDQRRKSMGAPPAEQKILVTVCNAINSEPPNKYGCRIAILSRLWLYLPDIFGPFEMARQLRKRTKKIWRLLSFSATIQLTQSVPNRVRTMV